MRLLRSRFTTPNKTSAVRGFGLVETMIAAALMLLVFGGIFAGLHLMMEIITHSKAEAGARSLAIDQMEYIRSLDYDNAATIAGIPAGTIPQSSTTTLNGIIYDVRILIKYIDRPEDGFGENDNKIPGIPKDDNGIMNDSKVVKIVYSWTIKGDTKNYTLVSDIIPPGIESNVGGGTLFINVFDASVQPVSNAEVHIYNDAGSSPIDITVFTNANGMANFPGAPAQGGYEITVTKPGYSTDQTYSASSTNANPNPPHVAVAVGAVSTVYFAIDELSDLTLLAISTPVTSLFTDTFANPNNLPVRASTTVSGDEITLENVSGSYLSPGHAYATKTAPATIANWEYLDFNGTTTASSSYAVHMYSVSGSGAAAVYTLVPDTDLANNSTGFTEGPVNLTALDVATYPALAPGVTFTTEDNSETSILYDWSLSHVESETPISGVTFDLESSKTIGDNGGVPVHKYTNQVTTDGSGESPLTDMEWDAYQVTIDGGAEGYDISETYDPIPFALSPGVTDTLTFVLEPHVTQSLRVTVTDTLGAPQSGADVRLYNGGFDQTLETSIYGQAFFNSGVASATDYTIEVTKGSFDDYSQTDVIITSNVEMPVVMGTGGSGGGGASTSTTAASSFLADYTKRIPLSIAGTSLFGDVSDFPVYLDLSDLPSSFFTDVQSDGDDIRITTNDGLTEVPFELVSINTGAETGQLHFKAPSLLTSTTSIFYIYYEKLLASGYADSDTYGRNNVWINDYLAVYHLEEAQVGTGNSNVYIDSTGQGGDGDDNVTATDKTGKLGLGQEFNNAFTDNIELPYTVLDNQTDVTATFWYRTNTSDYMSILSGAKNDSSSGANEYLLWFQDRNDIQFFAHGSRENFDIFNINDNVYRYYASVRDDTNNQSRLYINGNEDNQSPTNHSMSMLDIAAGGLFIGVDQDSIGGSFDQELDGELDELRIVGGVRDSNWISNVYLNQNTPTVFYSIGSVEIE